MNYEKSNLMPTEEKKKEMLQLIDQRISSFQKLPPLATNLLNVINDSSVDTEEIVKGLRLDPSLTISILKLANSAYFGIPRGVSSVNEAIVRLGVKRLFDLIVASEIGSTLQKPLIGYDLHPEQLLQHSAWVAVASEEFCQELGLRKPDTIFTAGILHDIGKIIISDLVHDNWSAINVLAEEQKIPFDEAERLIIGLDHAEAGARILDKWNLPVELVETVRWHHAPNKAGIHKKIACVIHIADSLAYAQGAGSGLDGLKYTLSKDTVADMGITQTNVEYVASVTLDKMLELQDILRG